MTPNVYPERIETDRLIFEPVKEADPFELYTLVSREDWQEESTEHMPWFRFQHLDHVASFVENAATEWRERDTARYLLRSKDEGGRLVGVTGYGPEWEKRRAGTGIVLASEYWGREYGLERASVFVELTFERYDLDAFYSTCAAENKPSRRMIEKYVETYGGRHEGCLRHHSSRPNGDVTDQHRFTILREEYEEATAEKETLTFQTDWG